MFSSIKILLRSMSVCGLAALPCLFPTLSYGQAVNLQALGIDAGFELPDLGGNDGGEQVNLVGFGPGWSFTELAGEISDWGVQDPGVDFFPRVADTPDNDDLAGPFEGRQIGFVNLNTTLASAELVSYPVGKLQASSNYTLTVAVGIRQNQAAWTVDYEIGLRTLGGVDLGTFATINKNNLSLPEDLVYNLNIGAASPNIGEEVSIVVRSTNAAGDAFSQSAFDNVRLTGSFGAANTPILTINRGTGAMTLSKTGTDNLSILGYTLTSPAGSFNSAAWTEIGGALSVVSSTASDLSEAQLSGDAGISLSSGSPRNLGAAWYRTPFEDVEATLLLADGSLKPVVVQYTGAEIPFGDLTGDGAISAADWTAFKSGQGSNFAGLLDAQSYLLGDLDDDGDHDLADFITFRTAYDDFNGLGAFAAMAAAIPEPTSALLLSYGVAAITLMRRNRSATMHRAPATRVGKTFAGGLSLLLLAAVQPALAQVTGPIPVPNFSFQDPVIPTDGNPDDEDPFDTDPGSPLGWTYSYTAAPPGTESYGVQRPDPQSHFTRDVTGGETSPFNAPFDGDQIGFINLNNDGATAAQVDSGVLGQLAVGTYTLNFAVGGRNTGSWRNLDYTIGLIGANSGPLGTPTLQQIDPGNAAGNLPLYEPATNDFNVVDMEYTLTVPNGSPLIGEDFFIRLTVANTGLSGTGGFTQAAFDNARLVGPTVPQFGLYVDPESGQMQLRNPTDNDISLTSYRITSSSESLVESAWSPIADQGLGPFPTGDGSGNGWEKGPQTDDGELVEWYLQSDSTLPGGSYIDLGLAYDAVQDAQDLSFQYTRPDGSIASGLIYYDTIVPGDFDFDSDVDNADLATWQGEYAQFRSGRDFLTWQRNVGAGLPLVASIAVPEPSAACLLFGGFVGLVLRKRNKTQGEPDMPHLFRSGWPLCLAAIIGLCLSQAASAAVTIDRHYQMGDDSGEGATVPGTVGQGNAFNTTFDSSNVAGFRDLVPENSPTYADVSPSDLARPGAGANAKGIELNGTNYLRGLRFNDPATAPGSTGGTPSGAQDYAGITNRGFQLWVLPSQAGLDGTTDQYVVHDTTEHGLKIDGDNSWIMIYDGGEHDSGVAATSTWTHVMVVRPYSGQNNIGGSLLYVNGVAIEGEAGPYDVTPEPGGEAQYVLTVGTDTGNGQSDLISDGNQLFSGVVDDLTFFASGTTTNGLHLGTFNFGEDNGWAQLHLTGVDGDVDQNGALDPVADVDALIAGWGSQKIVDGIFAGDMTTIVEGDLNFDGRTNLADAFLLHQALLTAGFTDGLDFSLLQNIAVPEPSSLTFVGIAMVGWFSGRRR